MNVEQLEALFVKIIKESLLEVKIEILERNMWPAPPHSLEWEFSAGLETVELRLQYLAESIKYHLPTDIQHIKVLNKMHLHMSESFYCGAVYIIPIPNVVADRNHHDE